VSVRLRILVLVLCVVLSCLAAAAWAVASTYAREKAAMEQAVRETARALSLVVDRELGRREAVAWTLATSPSLRAGDLRAFHLQAAQATAGTTGWVVLFGPDGMLVNTSLPPGTELPRRPNGRPTVRVTDSGATVSDLFRGPATDRWVLAISVPIRQPDMTGYGISVVVPAEDMQRVIDDQKLAPGWIATIADRQGTIVARQPDAPKWLGHSVTPDLAQQLKAAPEGFLRSRALDGTAATAFFSTSPNYRWAFVIGVPNSLLGASLQRSVLETGAMAVLLLIVAGAAAAIVGRRIAGPAQQLQRAAEALKAGTPMSYRPAGVAEFDAVGATLAEAQAKLLEADRAIQLREQDREALMRRMQSQLSRMELLHQITRAIGDRLDLTSVFQVLCNSLERQSQVGFCAVALYDADGQYAFNCLGAHSRALATEHGLLEHAAVDMEPGSLSRCVQGLLVYEADLTRAQGTLAERLAAAGLRSAVLAPLQVADKPFGLLIAARDAADAFSSGDCEFLRQLSEHVALAAHQAQLHGALRSAYDDLRRTQQAAMQQERLRALGQMASGIAHDINNAISPIALYAESLLERETGLSARTREQLQIIARAIDDVAATVARMREFYRQRDTQLALAPLALNPLVQQVADLTRARWSDMPQQHGVAIRLHMALADDLPQVLGIESEIREALINLVFNAVDAMPEGGELTLRTSIAKDTPPARVQVEVTDTGVGMDDDTRRRCLEPFFTTKGERGTGLGLAMVYGTVQRHGADIEIRSEPGHGTTVALRFAVPDGTLVAAAQPAAALDAPAPPRLRILVVDDDPLVLETLQRLLEADGHAVVAAQGGQAGIAAFDAARARGEMFSVVMTDLGMPQVDGRAVAAAVKQASPSTPVIMLTGWGQAPDTQGTPPRHVDRVLGKPPKLRELREVLSLCAGPSGASS
jgi:signal transduction histidine kinase